MIRRVPCHDSMNKLTAPCDYKRRNPFHKFLFPYNVVILYFVQLPFSFLQSARLLHLFATAPILWGHHFTSVCFSFSSFSFVKVHCVRLFSYEYLCSFPPPLLQRLSSVITALDSSSDGKCFFIPLLSITLLPSLLFSFSHQANYILVTIETCLLSTFSTLSYFPLSPFTPPPLLSSAPPVSLCVFSFLALLWSSVSLSSFLSHAVWGAISASFVTNRCYLERKDENWICWIDFHCCSSGSCCCRVVHVSR